MRADKPDASAAAIVEDLRARGYVVEYAKGLPFDLLVIGYHRLEYRTICVIVECKNEGEPPRFTPRERRFQDELENAGFMSVYCVATCAEHVRACFGDY
jgi:hypothetical protein